MKTDGCSVRGCPDFSNKSCCIRVRWLFPACLISFCQNPPTSSANARLFFSFHVLSHVHLDTPNGPDFTLNYVGVVSQLLPSRIVISHRWAGRIDTGGHFSEDLVFLLVKRGLELPQFPVDYTSTYVKKLFSKEEWREQENERTRKFTFKTIFLVIYIIG